MLLPFRAFRADLMPTAQGCPLLCAAIAAKAAVGAEIGTAFAFLTFFTESGAIRAIFAAIGAKVTGAVSAIVTFYAHRFGTFSANAAPQSSMHSARNRPTILFIKNPLLSAAVSKQFLYLISSYPRLFPVSASTQTGIRHVSSWYYKSGAMCAPLLNPYSSPQDDSIRSTCAFAAFCARCTSSISGVLSPIS